MLSLLISNSNAFGADLAIILVYEDMNLRFTAWFEIVTKSMLGFNGSKKTHPSAQYRLQFIRSHITHVAYLFIEIAYIIAYIFYACLNI